MRIALGNNRRTYSQVFQSRKGNSYGFRKAEGKKLNFFAWPQNAKRQNDEPAQRSRLYSAFNGFSGQRPANIGRHELSALVTVLRGTRQGSVDDSAEDGDSG